MFKVFAICNAFLGNVSIHFHMYRYFSFNDYDLFNVGYVFFCNDKTPSYSPMNHHAKKSILLFLININVNEFISSFGWPEQKEQVNFLSVFFFWHLPCLSVHILILTKKNPKDIKVYLHALHEYCQTSLNRHQISYKAANINQMTRPIKIV